MTAPEILSVIQTKFPEIKLELQQGPAGDPWILVTSGDVANVIRILKNELGLNYLACLSGIDYQDSLGVVYQLRSLSGKFEIMVKTLAPLENPCVPTISDLYASANWFEREAYDLIGIQFQGHPDLRRIMMPEDWVGHPLRKDYQSPAEYHGISTSRPNTHQLLDQLRTAQNRSDEKSKVDTVPHVTQSGTVIPKSGEGQNL